MAENSKIEWTDHTFNPWRGCTKVALECAACYAEKLSFRNPGTLGVWGLSGTRVVAGEAMWREPAKWDQLAEAARRRHRVFCASLADVFEEWPGQMQASSGARLWVNELEHWEGQALPGRSDVIFYEQGFKPLRIDDVRRRLFALIDATPNLDWLLLTKRPENVVWMWNEPMLRDVTIDNYQEGRNLSFRSNVWLGTSAGTQETADQAIPELLKRRHLSPVLFVSAEPLLGRMNLLWLRDDGRFASPGLEGLDWLIIGCESNGKRVGRLGAFTSEADWCDGAADLVRQCREAGVPVFVKQVPVGGRVSHDPAEWPEALRVREFPGMASGIV